MRRTTGPAVATVFLLSVSACAHNPPQSFDIGPSPTSAPAAGVSFAGTWTYNPDASDRPGQGYGMRGGFGGGGGGGFGGRGGFGGEGGEEGGYGRGEGRGGRGMEALDSTLRRPARRLIITQSDSTLTVSPRDSVSYTLFFDGRDVVAPDLLGGTRVRLSGHWHKKQFEVARELPDGATITESYEVAKHGQRLVIHVRVSRAADEQVLPEFQLVYDRYQ